METRINLWAFRASSCHPSSLCFFGGENHQTIGLVLQPAEKGCPRKASAPVASFFFFRFLEELPLRCSTSKPGHPSRLRTSKMFPTSRGHAARTDFPSSANVFQQALDPSEAHLVAEQKTQRTGSDELPLPFSLDSLPELDRKSLSFYQHSPPQSPTQRVRPSKNG